MRYLEAKQVFCWLVQGMERLRGGRRDPTVEMYADFIGMPFMQTYKEVKYDGRLASLMTKWRIQSVATEVASPGLWYGGFDL